MTFRRLGLWVLTICAWTTLERAPAQAAPRADGQLQIDVVDAATGKPIPVRMHLNTGRKSVPNATGKPRAKPPVKLGLPDSAEFGGHFYIDGSATLPLRVGQYNFELEATPEYLTQTGQFDIQRHADDSKRVEMKRVVDLEKEGWFGGDLDASRDAKDLPLIMRAEGLQVVPQIAAEKKSNDEPLDIDGHLIAQVPYAWNLPVWLAEGNLEGIELINRHALREGVVDNEDDGRPRDKTLFPGTRGNGRWAETVYYHILNCGLRIPPVAGSGSGANDNPVGTNRMYVFCGKEFSENAWWNGLQDGRVFVTNGPLLRPMVEGEPPGHVFQTAIGTTLSLQIGLNLATRVPVDYLQVIKDGKVDVEVRLAEWKDKKGKLPPVTFDESGWFLVRAVTSNPQAYQFASTGPFYVQQSDRPRISRKSAQFFLDWIEAADARLQKLPKLDDAERAAQLARQEQARKFFSDLLATANAE